MSLSPHEYIRHIIDEIDYILSQISGTDFDSFLRDGTLKRAFVRSLEIIGEASKKLPEDVKARKPDIEWRKVTGMRDKLIHDYFGVDYTLVWVWRRPNYLTSARSFKPFLRKPGSETIQQPFLPHSTMLSILVLRNISFIRTCALQAFYQVESYL